MRLSLLVLAAGLAITPQALAYSAKQCTSYLIGSWQLEDETKQVKLGFGSDGNLKADISDREEWSKWSAADGKTRDTCEITIIDTTGRNEFSTFTLVDEDIFQVRKQTFRRTFGSGKAIREADANTFDNATCPTYFVGAWTSENSKKTYVTRAVFGADGAYTVTEGKIGKPPSDVPLNGTWRAVAGAKAGWCTVTVAAEGRENDGELEILGANSFADPKSKMIFNRE